MTDSNGDLVERAAKAIRSDIESALVSPGAKTAVPISYPSFGQAKHMAAVVIATVLDDLMEPSMDMGLAGADKVNEQMRGTGSPADYDAAMDSFRTMMSQKRKELGL